MAKLFLLLSLVFQIAVDAEAITLSGLNFTCQNCKRLSDETCEFTSDKELLAISCKALFSLLIDRELSREQTSLSEISLLRTLVASKTDGKDASNLLKLLLSFKEIDRRLLGNYEQAFLKNYELLKNQIVQKNFSNQQVTNLLKIVTISQKTNLQLLIPVVVNSQTNPKPEHLLRTLSANSLTYDLQTLIPYSQSIRANSLIYLKGFSSFVDQLKLCALKNKIEKLDCLGTVDDSSFKNYAKKLFLNEALSSLLSSELGIEASLNILSRTAYREFANQTFYGFVFNQLSSLKNTEGLNSETAKMLRFLALYHSGIASKLHLLIQKNETQGNAKLYCALLLIFALSFFALWWRLYLARAKTQRTSTEQQLLMQYFDLPVWASKKDLKKKYREKIKTLHPDTNIALANEEDFQRTCQNYKRACVLMNGSDDFDTAK